MPYLFIYLSYHLHAVALLLVLIASIVLICKSLWIKVSAKGLKGLKFKSPSVMNWTSLILHGVFQNVYD